MSECVVRMEMPKNCYVCEMRGAWAFCPIGKWPVVGYKKQRHEDCPILCQLPEGHGRLGDLDELAAWCDAPYWCRWLGEIEDAPTIVPAERSET